MNKKLIILIVLFSVCIPLPVQTVSTRWIQNLRARYNHTRFDLVPADATATSACKYKSAFSLKFDWTKVEASITPYRLENRISYRFAENMISRSRKTVKYREISPYRVGPNKELIKGNNGFEMLVDRDKMTLTIKGKEIPIHVDGDARIMSLAEMDATTWIHLPYNRFDIYVDSVYYYHNTPAIDDFFNKFEPRFALLESVTGWSSEEYYGLKLKINVTGDSGCSWGYALPGNAVIYFSDLYNPGCEKLSYYENGTSYYGNPGELGDDWQYMTTALHETLHSINPFPIYSRSWLTEGFSEYNIYNILSNYYGNSYPDITQETADYYLHTGIDTVGYRWNEYVANDYHDTTENNNPIQESHGYDITAWMFSMLRDNYSLNWNNFYSTLNNNLETLNKSREIGGGSWYSYYTDTHIIDIFGKALGHTNFETQTKPIFRYDGPSGPGWGVRNWTDLDWYADLSPNLAVSDTLPSAGDSIQLNATIYNTGAVSLNNVVVRFYSDTTLVKQQVVGVPESSLTIVSIKCTAHVGLHTMKVVANESHVKIEKNYSNNEASIMVRFLRYGDANGDDRWTVSDAVYLINYLFKAGSSPIPILLAGDANCDTHVTVSDVVFLINYLFKGGPQPCT